MQVAAIVAQHVNDAARDSIELIKARNRRENMAAYRCDCPAAKCYDSCPRFQIHADGDETFALLARFRPPDRRDRGALPLDGAIVFGGGGKSGRKRSKIPPKATVWSWHEL
jgi:hypothetical protein